MIIDQETIKSALVTFCESPGQAKLSLTGKTNSFSAYNVRVGWAEEYPETHDGMDYMFHRKRKDFSYVAFKDKDGNQCRSQLLNSEDELSHFDYAQLMVGVLIVDGLDAEVVKGTKRPLSTEY